jgi:hypothetical protein
LLTSLSSGGGGIMLKVRARTTIVKNNPTTECTHIAIHKGQDGFGVKMPVVLTSIIAKLSRKIESTSGDGVMSKNPLL